MIIECPACKTRFALHDGQLAGILNPRFHCSRCGNVFGLTAPNSAEPTYQPSITSSLLGNDTNADAEKQLSLIPDGSPTAAESPIVSSPNSLLTEDEATVKTFTDVLEDSPAPIVTARWPSGAQDRIYEADMRQALEKHLENGPAPVSANALLGRWNKLRRETPSAKKDLGTPAGTPAAPALEADLQPQASLLSQAAKSISTSVRTPTSPVLSFPAKKLATIIDDELENDRLMAASANLAARAHHRSPLEFISPVATFCVVPLVFLAGIGIFGDDLVASKPVAQSLARLVPAAEEKAPPSGLSLHNLETQVVTLEDGRRVLEVSGKVRNESPVRVHEVRLETKLFDDTNHTVAAQHTYADNRLANAESVAALRADALEALQWERVPGNEALEPGVERQFRVVFVDNTSDAKFFTSRIYSVATEYS